MQKLCIISQYFLPDFGGAVTRLTNLLKILNSMNYEIIIVTTVPHYPNGEIPLNYRIKWKHIEKSGKIKIIRMRMPSIPHDSITNRLINYLYFVWTSIIGLPKVTSSLSCLRNLLKVKS